MKLNRRGVQSCPVDAKHLRGGNAPQWFCIFLFVIPLLSLILGCEESEQWVEDPSSYLETAEFPGYILRLPLFGINGYNGLKPPEKASHCSAYGVYVSSSSKRFLRAFTDSVLYYIPLEDHLPYATEHTVVRVEGKVIQNGEPSLSGIQVISAEDIEAIRESVLRGYPKLLDRIAAEIHHPKSKLDLKSIETFHCAASGNELLIFGRTYDLMYEFTLAFLFTKEGESYELKRIYAREFFKGE